MSENKLKTFGHQPQGVLQFEYSLTHNGYGLLQLSTKVVMDSALVDFASNQVRGLFFIPYDKGVAEVNNYSTGLAKERWTLVKSEERGRDGNLVEMALQYAAVAKSVGGETTQTEATITSSAVSEPIESHPNFSYIQIKQIGNKGDNDCPLGGKLDPNPPLSAKYDANKNKYMAKWIQSTQGQTQSYQFVGFLPPQTKDDPFNRKAGIKSYFRPSITMKLVAYTIDQKKATDTAKYVGWICDDGIGVLSIPPVCAALKDDGLKVQSKDPSANKGKNWLVTSTNLEVYGGLYKVTADLMLSGYAGWDEDVYPKYTGVVSGTNINPA